MPAARKTLHGKETVLGFLAKGLHRFWAGYRWRVAAINGSRAIALEQAGTTVAVVTFAYNEDGKATDVFIVRNPDKLTKRDPLTIH